MYEECAVNDWSIDKKGGLHGTCLLDDTRLVHNPKMAFTKIEDKSRVPQKKLKCLSKFSNK